MTTKHIPHWSQAGKGRRRVGGHKAKRAGQTVEARALAAARLYEGRGQAITRHVGPPVRQIGPMVNGRFTGVYDGEGPPDLLVELAVPSGPARLAWVEVKGRRAASMPLNAVERHQLEALMATARSGNPALVLVCLHHESKGGWWLVPAARWSSPDGERQSLTPEHMSALGCQCQDINVPGRLAGADAVPDWLEAMRRLDARDDCPWVRVW